MATVEQLLERARDECRQGALEAAESTYGEAAELARSQQALPALAHALRHLAELATRRGAGDHALNAAEEAVAIYQADVAPLDLANAYRVRALALEGADRSVDAALDWRAARALYDELGIASGVAECDARLRTA